MLISLEEQEQRRKAIRVLMARWAKSVDTKQKAFLIMERNRHPKTRDIQTTFGR